MAPGNAQQCLAADALKRAAEGNVKRLLSFPRAHSLFVTPRQPAATRAAFALGGNVPSNSRAAFDDMIATAF